MHIKKKGDPHEWGEVHGVRVCVLHCIRVCTHVSVTPLDPTVG